MKRPPTAIVIVNWNGWEDTVRCVAACGYLEEFNGAVLVVDNGSTDGSFDQISGWCRGRGDVPSTSAAPRIVALEQRSPFPLSLVAVGDEAVVGDCIRADGLVSRGIYVICATENKGFGGGNNIGIRLAMLDPHCQLFWFLNSDAIPEPGALKAVESVCLPMQRPLVCGSVLLNYDRPMTVQAFGSKVSYLTLKTSHQLENAPVSELGSYSSICRVGAPVGASMLLNRAYVDQFGLFDERLFLYYEELDLVSRLPDRGSFICTRSMVYHKGGRSTKGGHTVLDRSVRADYEFLKSRTLLARKIGGLAVLMSVVTMTLSLAKRLVAKRTDLARHVIPAFRDGWRSASMK